MAFPYAKIGLLFRPAARPSLYLYLTLRGLQLGASTLTLSYFCSLIGWHNAHYCSTRFYKNECSLSQQAHARVPTLYIVFATVCCFSILSAFGLSYRQMSWFFSFDSNSSANGNSSEDAPPLSKRLWRALRPVLILASIIDAVVFIALGLCLQSYWTSIIRPNHMYPNSGYKFPVCWLFEWTPATDATYWKNQRVEMQRCMDNQISFYGAASVLVIMFAILVGDAIYLYSDRSSKAIANGDTISDGLRKNYIPQPLFIENGRNPSSTETT